MFIPDDQSNNMIKDSGSCTFFLHSCLLTFHTYIAVFQGFPTFPPFKSYMYRFAAFLYKLLGASCSLVMFPKYTTLHLFLSLLLLLLFVTVPLYIWTRNRNMKLLLISVTQDYLKFSVWWESRKASCANFFPRFGWMCDCMWLKC